MRDESPTWNSHNKKALVLVTRRALSHKLTYGTNTLVAFRLCERAGSAAEACSSRLRGGERVAGPARIGPHHRTARKEGVAVGVIQCAKKHRKNLGGHKQEMLMILPSIVIQVGNMHPFIQLYSQGRSKTEKLCVCFLSGNVYMKKSYILLQTEPLMVIRYPCFLTA